MPDDYKPRRAKPGQTFTMTGPNGEQVDLSADDAGIIVPRSANEEALLDRFGLKGARKGKGADDDDDDDDGDDTGTGRTIEGDQKEGD